MLSADEQERIIKTNNQASEELALRWRDPQTGETEPDVKRAIQRMVCSYLSVPCYSCNGDRLYSLICGLQEAAAEEDGRVPVKLTEEDIPAEARKISKRHMPIPIRAIGIGMTQSGIGNSHCTATNTLTGATSPWSL